MRAEDTRSCKALTKNNVFVMFLLSLNGLFANKSLDEIFEMLNCFSVPRVFSFFFFYMLKIFYPFPWVFVMFFVLFCIAWPLGFRIEDKA